MIIFPAIDIKDNKCVRLTQGNYSKVKVYDEDPVMVAKEWEAKGTEYLHIVDLDGARGDFLVNDRLIEKIIKEINIPVQIGGGNRSYERVSRLISLGVSRVILGTVAIEEKELVRKMAVDFADKLAVSVDAVEGKAKTRGWENETNVDVLEVCSFMEQIGIKTLIYTDILKDGMLEGPNLEIYSKLMKETSLDIVASGGVTTLEDVNNLKNMNMYGAIIGKAFYDKRLEFEEVKNVSKENNSLFGR
jgi:phosphoribosylformimino-5-aminoimidazole carboxamide ribotide isomerase